MTLAAPTTTAAAAATPVEIIIDDPQATFTGTWSTSSFQPRYYGTGYRVTDRSAASATRVATWKPTLLAAGSYTVSVWLPDGKEDRPHAVKYRLHHNGTVSEFTLDQTVTGGRWRQLGRQALPFSGTGDEYLELRIADVPAAPNNAPLFILADAVRFATPPPPLTVAPKVTAKTGRNYIELHWAALDGATGYIVERRDENGEFVEQPEIPGTAYLDLDVDSDATREYRVRGHNGAGLGPVSDVISAAPVAGPPLQAVQGLVLTSDAGRPHLSWQPQRDAESFIVYRSSRSAGNFKMIARANSTEFTDISAPRHAYYIVRAVNRHGESALSSWQVNWKA